MTPANFAGNYGATADQVAAGTGIDPIVLQAQWANETAWGTVVVGNNLGNIRCSSTTFCQYATLADFAVACIATWHNGYYGAVLSATTADAQLAAICASPWSSGHYGGSLAAFYTPLEDFELTANQAQVQQQIYFALFGDGSASDGYAIHNGALYKALVAAIPGGGVLDLAPVLTAVAAVQTSLIPIQAAVVGIKSKTDKDLA